MIAITIASLQEISDLKRKLSIKEQETLSGSVFMKAIICSREIMVVETGVGKRKAAFSAKHLIEKYSPSVVACVGAAGALDPGLNIGDIVVVKENLRSSSGGFKSDRSVTDKVFSLLSGSGLRVVYGNCLTVKRFVHSGGEKQSLFNVSSASVVDMESAVMADFFSRKEIPFINIRVVSDTAAENTVNVIRFLNARTKSGVMGAYFYLITNPMEILYGVRLRRNIAKAAKIISGIVETIVEELG